MPKKKTAARSKSVRSEWFYQVRGSYLPCAPEGWLVYLIFILAMLIDVYFLVDLYGRQHAGYPLYGVIKYLLDLVLGYYILTAIAKKHSRK